MSTFSEELEKLALHGLNDKIGDNCFGTDTQTLPSAVKWTHTHNGQSLAYPSVSSANMLWFDTSTGLYKRRNSDNTE